MIREERGSQGRRLPRGRRGVSVCLTYEPHHPRARLCTLPNPSPTPTLMSRPQPLSHSPPPTPTGLVPGCRPLLIASRAEDVDQVRRAPRDATLTRGFDEELKRAARRRRTATAAQAQPPRGEQQGRAGQAGQGGVWCMRAWWWRTPLGRK